MDVQPFVYCERPWLVSVDEPEVAAYFRAEGALELFPVGADIAFGRERRLYFIENGLVATIPEPGVGIARVVGLFGANTTLGLVRALRRGGGRMKLRAVTLSAVRTKTIPLDVFDDWLASQPVELRMRVLQNCISKSECQLEGVLVNDLQSVNARLLWLVETLFVAAARPLEPGFAPLPWPITISTLSMMAHTTREMASRGISEWCREGVFKREGRRLLVDRTRLKVALEAVE